MADELGGIAIVGDVRSEADATAAVERVGADLGPLTILVNNAGITGRTDLSWNLTLDEMRLVMDVNVLGPFLFSKAAVPGMLRANMAASSTWRRSRARRATRPCSPTRPRRRPSSP